MKLPKGSCPNYYERYNISKDISVIFWKDYRVCIDVGDFHLEEEVWY